ALRTTASAFSASVQGTAKQIECSDEACEIKMTDTPTSRSAPKSRCATPGTPIIPVPSTLSRAMCSTDEKPLTGCRRGSESGLTLPDAGPTTVPGADGLKLLRIRIGMPFSEAGSIVPG